MYSIAVAARALVTRGGSDLLLVSDDGGTWYTPGGRLGPGESLNECVARAVHEETGLKVDVGDLVYVAEFCRPYQQRRAYATCRQLWPELEVICASDLRPLDDYIEALGDWRFVISMIVGDTKRVMEYPKLGHAIAQKVPRRIEAAVERLIAGGFTHRQLSAGQQTS